MPRKKGAPQNARSWLCFNGDVKDSYRQQREFRVERDRAGFDTDSPYLHWMRAMVGRFRAVCERDNLTVENGMRQLEGREQENEESEEKG